MSGHQTAALRDEHAQTVQRALRMTKSLLFVGFGGGLDDPNFGALLRWTCAVFRESEYRHYRLVLDSEEIEAQKRAHAGHRAHRLCPQRG